MGVDTKGLINPNTTESELLEYLNANYSNVESRLKRDDFFEFQTSGFISFYDNNEHRVLFFISKSLDDDYIDGINLKGSTYISMGCFGNSVNIIKGICSKFGGVIDDNDCDDKGYYWVDKDKFFKDIEINLSKELELYFGNESKNKIIEILKRHNIAL